MTFDGMAGRRHDIAGAADDESGADAAHRRGAGYPRHHRHNALLHEKVGRPERSEHVPLVRRRRGGQHFHFAVECKEIGVVPSLRLKRDALQAMNAPPAIREA